MSADALLDKPAGRDGVVIVRDDHFYTAARRLRFWGVNIAFAGNFPAHDQADAVAERLARFGINAVRLHHMDSQPFPNGIFADDSLEKLSPDALDRLDYFVAALKKQGVYSDINLHVSRNWSRSHHWPNADELPQYDKVVDIFHPDLIAAQKQYARDLLTHVNAYTGKRYADEPAVGLVEITNEDTIFLWGGEGLLAKLPEPYAGMLQQQWNAWLLKKYGSLDKLKAAWAVEEEPLGENMLPSSPLDGWHVETHDTAKMTAQKVSDGQAVQLDVQAVDGTDWHLQYTRAGIHLKKGQYYTLRFDPHSDQPVTIAITVGQAHEPWQMLGLATRAALTPNTHDIYFGFTAADNDDNARISFAVGEKAPAQIILRSIELAPGGREGLRGAEDPQKGAVMRGGFGAESPARSADWYDFLQQADQAYFDEMRRFLKEDIGVKCPITGTIGLGPLGTLSQSHMDFVDAHAYWDHPSFPHRQWDQKDWLIHNTAMVDSPAGATLWGLAATRVPGKPFTVTEYNHAAPNEWQAECLPIIASYAALQDWDGIFLFAYSHNAHYDKGKIDSFFDMEGNPLKMDLSPAASRIFLAQAVQPSPGWKVTQAKHEQMLSTASQYYYTIWPWARDLGMTWQNALTNRLGVDFSDASKWNLEARPDDRIHWTSAGPGTGRFTLADPHAAVFVGFAGDAPVDLGAVRIERLTTPFATLMLVPADPAQEIASADRLLLATVGRGDNTGMQWDEQRRTVSDHWGSAPPRIEVVSARLSVAGRYRVYALTPDGQRGPEIAAEADSNRTGFEIGPEKTMWYELVKD